MVVSDYCKEEYQKFKAAFGDGDINDEGFEELTGLKSRTCAYRYHEIHGAVIRMGGFANFSHYVNRCAETDYQVFKELKAKLEVARVALEEWSCICIRQGKALDEFSKGLSSKMRNPAFEALAKIGTSGTKGEG